MRFFKRKTAYPAKRNEASKRAWEAARRGYEAHLKAIAAGLPEGARELARTVLHDARVRRIERPSKSVLVIVLSGGYALAGETVLTFTGVKQAWVPDAIVGDEFLFYEISTSDLAAFDYQVLLVRDEIRIQADDVQIQLSP
jgi:hypothetical protein